MIPVIQLGPFTLPTYYLIISGMLCVLLYWLSIRVSTFQKNREHAFNISLLLMLSAFWGARLMHVIYENPDYYIEHPLHFFYFWNGGFAYYGGLILCAVTGFIYVRFNKLNFFEWADFFTPLFSLSHAIGRLGCVLAGCCFGTYCELPWAIDGKHPTALYLAVGEFMIFLYLYFAEKLKIYKNTGILFLKWLLLHSLLRFNVEFFRDDFRGQYLLSMSISQIISLLIAGISLICLYRKTSLEINHH